MNKQQIAIPNTGTGTSEKSVIRVSLPGYPWGEVSWQDRRETAPRGNRMVSRPVTALERIERAAWKAGA